MANNNARQYICERCNRAFGSYLALGGHMATHVREDRRLGRYIPPWAPLLQGPANPVVQQQRQQQQQPAQQQHQPAHQQQLVQMVYICPLCNIVLLNQQDVEAHRRTCRAPGAGRELFVDDFDLNEHPPEP